MIVAVLRVILVIRPVRLLCPYCGEEKPVARGEKRDFPFLSGFSSLGRKNGCSRCGGSGYAGRRWLTELVALTPELKECILKAGDSWDLKQNWEEAAGDDILRQARELLREGKIDLEEYERVLA